ncbi:MAG: CoA transferase [Alphaproteobacteria bacterium]|nr:CoA transferase [Alphaproteobacteria bacterium]
MSDALAFEGLKVLDLSQGVAAPYCGLLLAQNGAEVIKVEPPAPGDWSRAMGKPYGDQSASSVILCRGKRSIALDLKKPGGVDVAKRLAREADVILQNYRPGVIEKFGLDYDSVHAANPDVVYLSVTGFGAEGPKAKHPATDSVMQAFTGFMSINRDATGMPQRIDFFAIDVITGLYCFQAVSSALYRRAVHGGGKHIRTSLMESALAFQEIKMVQYKLEGPVSEPIGAPVGTFKTKDGYICVNARRDPHFQALCRLFGREELIDDPRYADARSRVAHREDLLAIVSEKIAAKTTAEWVEALNGIDVLNAPVADYGDLFEHPQVAAMQAVNWIEHDTVGSVPMGHIAGVPLPATDNPCSHSPHIGEHSREILAGLGMSDGEIEALFADGAVTEPALQQAAE